MNDLPKDHPSYMTEKQQQEAIEKHIGAGQALSNAPGSSPSIGSEYMTLLETMVANIDPLEYPEDSLEAAAIRKNHRKYYPDNY